MHDELYASGDLTRLIRFVGTGMLALPSLFGLVRAVLDPRFAFLFSITTMRVVVAGIRGLAVVICHGSFLQAGFLAGYVP